MLLTLALACAGHTTPDTTPQAQDQPTRLRVATYNTSLFSQTQGDVLARLQAGGDRQIERIIAVMEAAHPDILIVQELDYDQESLALLSGLLPTPYPYLYHAPSNTGEPTGMDLDKDGELGGPGDAQGYGTHPGQYAFGVLSRYPIDAPAMRSWQTLLWQDMPNARLPQGEEGGWYTPQELAVLRLSSKNHIALPVSLGEDTLTLLVAHPTPPVFDGPEDRNGLRNADELRLLADVLSDASWLVDDKGQSGGLAQSAPFVVFGDMNADPVDGDSVQGAIQQLLEHPRVNPESATGAKVPSSTGGTQHDSRPEDSGDPAHDTSAWGQRVDYVLPSVELKVVESGVYWPEEGHDVEGSDHRLVWVDLEI